MLLKNYLNNIIEFQLNHKNKFNFFYNYFIYLLNIHKFNFFYLYIKDF